MKKGDSETKKGFTIIEVSLVLAIAGLIFLMVFIALPALRASQRDTQRRESVALMIDALKKYQSNNRGALPSSDWDDFEEKYLGNNFIDPNGMEYIIMPLSCDTQADVNCSDARTDNIYNAAFPNNYHMVVVTRATCNGSRAVGTSNPRRVAVLYMLERGGVYCANS